MEAALDKERRVRQDDRRDAQAAPPGGRTPASGESAAARMALPVQDPIPSFAPPPLTMPGGSRMLCGLPGRRRKSFRRLDRGRAPPERETKWDAKSLGPKWRKALEPP